MVISSGDTKVHLETSAKNIMIDNIKDSRDVECQKRGTLIRPCSTRNVVHHFKQSGESLDHAEAIKSITIY